MTSKDKLIEFLKSTSIKYSIVNTEDEITVIVEVEDLQTTYYAFTNTGVFIAMDVF